MPWIIRIISLMVLPVLAEETTKITTNIIYIIIEIITGIISGTKETVAASLI